MQVAIAIDQLLNAMLGGHADETLSARAHLEPYARDWFERNAGAPYDLKGNVRFVLPWLADSERGWFCSEAMGAALGWAEPWRFGPNGLSALLRSILKGE